MTWRERTVAQLVLLVARMISKDAIVRAELKAIANNITVHGAAE